MPLRGRLLALASRAAALANERRVVVAGRVLLLAGLLFLAVRLRSIWHDSRVDLGGVGWAALVGAFLASAAGVAASGVAWLAILRGLGVRTRLRWAGVMFQAQLAKYIPGTVWQYAGRAALARGRYTRAPPGPVPPSHAASWRLASWIPAPASRPGFWLLALFPLIGGHASHARE